ncbi:MAG: CPXCG motif-containing cysteine-rich protein [Gammaproteobacteria bacterium]|nr:CPXCG motif-containing cysteine-rich protein [Gammaproteobacteria bacterium]
MTGWLPEQRIDCPFCGEPITIVIDTSGGSQSYVEDCQVCCQPMQIVIDVEDGELLAVVAEH